jgi:hypothetical protein
MHIALAAYAGNIKRRDGGGLRVHAFLDSLHNRGHRITLLSIGGHSGVEHLSVTHRVKRAFFPVPFRRHGLQSQWPPDADLYVSLVPSWHKAALRQGRAWLDYFDLWSVIANLHARSAPIPSRLTSKAQATLWRYREIEESAAAVRTYASYADAQVTPGGVWLPTPVYDSLPARPTRPIGRVAGMLANWGYPPNRLAFDNLVHTWLPTLAKGHAVTVAGFGAETLPPHEGITNIGEVSSPEHFYRSIDVALAPMTSGGGMKVKVVEALAHDKPVLATPHATEGLPVVLAAACTPWQPTLSPEDIDALPRPRDSPAVCSALALFSRAAFASAVDDLIDRMAGPTT